MIFLERSRRRRKKTSIPYQRHVSTIGGGRQGEIPPTAHDATILFPGVAMTVGSIKGKEEVEEQNRFPIPEPRAPITSRRRGLSGAAERRLGRPPIYLPPDPCLKAFPFPTRVGVMDRSNPPPPAPHLFTIVFYLPPPLSCFRKFPDFSNPLPFHHPFTFSFIFIYYYVFFSVVQCALVALVFRLREKDGYVSACVCVVYGLGSGPFSRAIRAGEYNCLGSVSSSVLLQLK
ncbi:hypothetical protein AVEN_135432-1 [Araneus ventricosus]|uniref:Uncharacterized protein n=1 Tax=Araneus ventricosus TaxID=182803 RepID=A0A4Y2BCM3_ARAVE|nr:hypothetical protein AVEN_135432-1 [Araneus ventricosus]